MKAFYRACCGLLLVLLLIATVLLWWSARQESRTSGSGGPPSPPAMLVPFRTPGGILHTNGFVKTEVLRKDTGSWRGTTSSEIRLNATYHYEIQLRSQWNIYLDKTRHVAFIVAPTFRPQLPVAVDSRSVYEWTESGWGRFDKWDQLEALRREVSPWLERLATSPGYREVARGQARITVEEFVADWLLKSRGWPRNSETFRESVFRGRTRHSISGAQIAGGLSAVKQNRLHWVVPRVLFCECLPYLLRPKRVNRHFQMLRQVDHFKIRHPAALRFDSCKNVSSDIPSLDLKSGGQVALGKSSFVAQSSHLGADDVALLLHCGGFDTREIAAKLRCFVSDMTQARPMRFLPHRRPRQRHGLALRKCGPINS